jgi:hypothetical protein
LPDPATIGESPWPLMLIGSLALVSIELDDAELAAGIAEVLVPFSDGWLHSYACLLAPAAWSLGIALSAAGDHDAAVTELEHALGKTEQWGLDEHTARLHMDLARVMRRRNGDGDAARAAALLAQARSEAEAVAAPGLVAKIDALG